MMKSFNFCTLSSVITCVFAISCAGPVQEASRVPEGKPIKIERIAVVPFFYELDYPQEAVLEVPEEGGITPEVPSEVGRLLAEDLYDEMASKIGKIDVAYFETAAEEFREIRKENPEITYENAALRLGKSLEADAVLIGNVFEFRERKGGELGVSSPASVAFGTQLLDTGSGEIIWEAYYAETQKPLLFNIFELDKFIKRGGKWVTAAQLAEEGAVKITERLDRFLNTYLATN